jgi:hypothetical protein
MAILAFNRQFRVCSSRRENDHMTQTRYFIIGLFALIVGCGPAYVLPETKERPGNIVVSAYTQSGCLEDLQEAANRAGVEVRLKDVQTDLGWQILLFPFYKGYKCTGEIIGPARSRM